MLRSSFRRGVPAYGGDVSEKELGSAFVGCYCVRGTWHHVYEAVGGFYPAHVRYRDRRVYILSFAMLTLALKDLSLGMAYGIWGGVGTFLTTLIGIIFWNDPFSIVVGIGMIAVVAGIALLSRGTQEAEEAERAPAQG